MQTCSHCGSENFCLLGALGSITWLRCRDCGMNMELEGAEVEDLEECDAD